MFDLLSPKNCFRINENDLLLTGRFTRDDTLQPIYSTGVYWWEISTYFYSEKHVYLLLGAETTCNLLRAYHNRLVALLLRVDHESLTKK